MTGLLFSLLTVIFTPCLAVAASDVTQLTNLDSTSSAYQATAAPATALTEQVVADRPKQADFKKTIASQETRQMADWIVYSGDNLNMPFAIVDKINAKVFVFYPDGRLRGSAPALLGQTRGDNTVPGIGDRKISSIRPEERTTPAGRFVSALDRNLRGEEILWVDYDSGISMHKVHSNKPKERRLQRLASSTPLDNRISYGCINVPVKFFENVVRPAFKGTDGVVYVLPETRSARDVFSLYDFEREFSMVEIVKPSSQEALNK